MPDKARAASPATIASINGIVEYAWTADRQWRQLRWTGVGVFIGAVDASSVLPLIG